MSEQNPMSEQNNGQAGNGRDDQPEMLGATPDTANAGLEKDPENWVSGDEPMTPAQRSYLDTLAKRAGEQVSADLTKAQASEQIDRLQQDSQ